MEADIAGHLFVEPGQYNLVWNKHRFGPRRGEGGKALHVGRRRQRHQETTSGRFASNFDPEAVFRRRHHGDGNIFFSRVSATL